MENSVQLFRNPEFGNVNVILDEDGRPWFVGKDVATFLGYRNPSEAIKNHVREHNCKCLKYKAYSKTLKASLWSGNDFSDKWLVNEFGLYSLIMGSKLESAQKFQDWVYEEVLPSIRKTGSYSTQLSPVSMNDRGETVVDPQYLLAIANQMVAQKDKIALQEATIRKKECELRDLDKYTTKVEGMVETRDKQIAEKNAIIQKQHQAVQDACCYIESADIRTRINDIIHNASGHSFRSAYDLLYKEYDRVTHQNIRTQMNNRDYNGSQMAYICEEKNDAQLLYNLCVKLFYEDVERLKEDFCRFAPNGTKRKNRYFKR